MSTFSRGYQDRRKPITQALTLALAGAISQISLAGQGPALLKDINPGAGSSRIQETLVVGRMLYFVTLKLGVAGDYELWRSDGSSAGTQRVKSFPVRIEPPQSTVLRARGGGQISGQPTELTAVGGELFFVAAEDQRGRELWRSDGSEQGTAQVTEIFPGYGERESPRYLAALGGTLLFNANDGNSGEELWRSDGTAAGTALLKDIAPGEDRSDPGDEERAITVAGDQVYFSVDIDGRSADLWRSDGSEQGTLKVSDLTPAPGLFMYPEGDGAISIGDQLFMVMNVDDDNDFDVHQLWTSDGSDAGTLRLAGDFSRIESLVAASNDDEPVNAATVGETLFFVAEDTNNNDANSSALWVSDGTITGTRPIDGLMSGDLRFEGLAAVGTSVVAAVDVDRKGDNSEQLWASDGGAATLLADFGRLDFESQLATIAGSAFFIVSDDSGTTQLWRSDGTAGGTDKVLDFPASVRPGDGRLDAAGETLFFTLKTAESGIELWSYTVDLPAALPIFSDQFESR